MNCRRVVNLISAYVDGELTGVEMLDIRRHLGECPDCMEEYESLRATKMMVARLGVIAPRPDFAANLVLTLNQTSISSHQKLLTQIYNYAGRKLSPVVAALAVFGVALALLTVGGQDKFTPNTDVVVANAPLSLHSQEISFVPEIPDNVMYSHSRPLVLANESAQGSLRFAGISFR